MHKKMIIGGVVVVILLALALIYTFAFLVKEEDIGTDVSVADIMVGSTYYVDSEIGSDSNSCEQAKNPETPKRTPYGINKSCSFVPGDVIKFRGTFSQRIEPPADANGQIVLPYQAIGSVSGSQVVFNQQIGDLSSAKDYVTIYNSRKGNSGAFPVIAAVGNTVTVDTSDLPAGQFLEETADDPGDLSGAIVRPIHYTAWDRDNPPVWNADIQTYMSDDNEAIMVSYLKSISGYPNTTQGIWPAFEINGDAGSNDYHIFDHLEITNADCGIAIEDRQQFHANYVIVQHNYLYDMGNSNYSNEFIYFGNAYSPHLNHDRVQIMYNKIGPHRQGGTNDGIEIKPSSHYSTVFGNEIYAVNPNWCDDAPIKTAGYGTFIANNYIHGINPVGREGCGISVVNENPDVPLGGADDVIVANNIVADVAHIGIRVMDADNVKVINNTVYNIFEEDDCSGGCREKSMGILVQSYFDDSKNILIRNNIVSGAYYGIGRFIGSNGADTIDSDYNIVHNSIQADFRGTVSRGPNDLLVDPMMINPAGGNFSLQAGSPALNAGRNMSTIFDVDNHDAADPELFTIVAQTVRTGVWDIGAYEGEGDTTTPEDPEEPQEPDPVCGDGVINQASEECEAGIACSQGFTCNTSNCTCEEDQPQEPDPVCGDGVINQASEECEAGIACSQGFTCDTSACICQQEDIQDEPTDPTDPTDPEPQDPIEEEEPIRIYVKVPVTKELPDRPIDTNKQSGNQDSEETEEVEIAQATDDQLANVKQVVVRREGVGEIEYVDAIDFSSAGSMAKLENLDEYIQIGSGYIEINSEEFEELDAAAKVKLENLDLDSSNIKILKDGEVAGRDVMNVLYDNVEKTLSFYVTGAARYEVDKVSYASDFEDASTGAELPIQSENEEEDDNSILIIGGVVLAGLIFVAVVLAVLSMTGAKKKVKKDEFTGEEINSGNTFA